MEIKPDKKATKPNYPALVIVGVGAAAACTALTLECCQRSDDKCPQLIRGGAPRIKVRHIPEQTLSGYAAPLSDGVVTVPYIEATREDAPARSERTEQNEPANSAPASD